MQELAELLTNRQNVAMQTEIILMLLLFLLPLYKLKKTKGVIVTWTLMFAAFLYLHQTLVAFVVAGFYMIAIFFLLYPTVMSFVPGRKKERLGRTPEPSRFTCSSKVLPFRRRSRP